MYDLTAINNATNILEITQSVNDGIAGGFLMVFVLSAIFLISFFTMKRYETNVAFVASSFITTIISIGFYFLEFIGTQGLIIPILLLMAAVITYLFSGN